MSLPRRNGGSGRVLEEMQAYTLTLTFVALLRDEHGFAQHLAIQYVIERIGGSFERIGR